MPFNSFNFWLIFPLVFAIYWLIPIRFNKWRKFFLTVVSYLLYINWKPAFALALFGVTTITFLGGYYLDKQITKKKRVAWSFALLGCLPLLIFKYYNFINESIINGLSQIGLRFSLPGLNCAIPVGISFFTFQAVGYFLDVYHGRIKAEKNFLDYMLFVSFFPQVTSGPISKADELLPQIKNSHKFDYEQGKQGLKWLLWGMFIKLVLADRLGMFVDTVYANYFHYNGTTCFVASVFYTIQIYCDFAGYSLMAIGIAATLGFNLINNFRRPYLATSVTDFWKRWHISLTRWLTQQVYIPLGGSRCSKSRCYLNILVTFLVSGIWHGANWTFILWGLMHGFLQIVEKALGWQKYGGRNRFVKVGRICTTFLLVSFAWIFFRMPTIVDSFNMVRKIITDFGTVQFAQVFTNGLFPLLIIFVGLFILSFKDVSDEFYCTKMSFLQTKSVQWIVYIFLFAFIITSGVLDGGQFIYVNF